METITLKKIHEDLEFVKKGIIEIKANIVDADIILTGDDIESLQKAEKDLREGKTKRLN